jgi:hypothetical protein
MRFTNQMGSGDGSLRISTSTGIELEIWREEGLFHAARKDGRGEPQVCLGIDLFEVIAELGELNLDDADHAEEAERLAEQAQRELRPLQPD